MNGDTEAERLEQIEQAGDRGTDLTGRLEAMRRDRAALMALETEPAPDWLLDAAIDRAMGGVDQRTLHLLEQGDGRPSPVPQVRPSHTRRVRVPLVPAMAAAVVLLVGGVVGLNVMRWFGPAPGAPGAPAAHAARADRREPGHRVDGGPGTAPLASSGEVRPRSTTTDEPAPVKLGGVPSLAEAVGLLREGRLALVARGGSSASIRPGLEAMATHAGSWAVSPGLPDAALARFDLPEPGRLVFASGGRAPAGELVHPVRSVWTARLDATPTAIASLRTALERLGLEVELRGLSAPNPVEPAPDAGDVLWWDRPPSAWRRPAAAALIVETLP
ncbi:MAG TPA: hypothetical protein ENK11_05255 [Phycisphaerales bacterium]|nr:hypothetical protein [Phycisphaerales bacterium]